MKNYLVTIPIAGHITFEVNAQDTKDAENIAWETDPDMGEISWEMLKTFCNGNLSYCPTPWEVEIIEL